MALETSRRSFLIGLAALAAAGGKVNAVAQEAETVVVVPAVQAPSVSAFFLRSMVIEPPQARLEFGQVMIAAGERIARPLTRFLVGSDADIMWVRNIQMIPTMSGQLVHMAEPAIVSIDLPSSQVVGLDLGNLYTIDVDSESLPRSFTIADSGWRPRP